jgi:hypothetical protein
MKLINFNDIPHFEFDIDMLNFESAEYDDDIICIPLTLKAYRDENFDAIRDVFEERMREFYFEETWDECIIDGEFSLIVWNEDTDCSYRLQFLAKDCDIETEIKLTDQEKSILSPIIQKAFGFIDMNKVRENVAKTFGDYISKDILNKLILTSDVLDGKEYRSAWITDDNQACVFAKIEDVQDKNFPVKMVKFGC